MQPYFFPYLGYFRLLAAADIFVLLDNVQFQRRGWVHRNRFSKLSGDHDWLTLPISKGHRDFTMINDVYFKDDVELREFLKPFEVGRRLEEILTYWPSFLESKGKLLEYLESSVITTSRLLGLSVPVVRASNLVSKNNLKGETYILALCEHLGAKAYINAPGGRTMYSQASFQKIDAELFFLRDYIGPKENSLERILKEDIKTLRGELLSNLELEKPL